MALGFISSYFTIFALALTLITAIYLLVKYDMAHIGRVTHGLNYMTEIVMAAKGSDSDGIDKIENSVAKTDLPGFLKRIWSSYYEGFRSRRGNQVSVTSAGSVPLPVLFPDIRDKFTPGSVIYLPASRSKAESAPAFIGNLGVVLFFIKLFVGLFGMDFSGIMTALRTASGSGGSAAADTASSTSLYAAIADIIAGLIGAFPEAVLILFTALALSFLYQYIDKRKYGGALAKLYYFHDTFLEQFPAADNGWLLGSMLAEQRRQTEALSLTAPDIVSSLDRFLSKNFIPSMLKSYEDAIKEHLKPVLANMGVTLDKMAAAAAQSQVEGMNALSESFLDRLNSFAGSQFSSLSNMLSDVSALQMKTKDALQSFNSSFDSTVAIQKQLYTSVEAVSGSIAEYQKDISQMSKQMTGTFEMTAGLVEKLKVMLEQVQSGMTETDNARQETKTQMDTYFSKMDEQVLRLTDDMHAVVENIFSRFNEMAGTTFERIETDLSKLADGFEDNSVRVLESMEQQSQSLGLYAKLVGDEVAELNDKLEISVNGFGEGIRDDVVKVFKEFDEGMTEISSRFAIFTREISESLDEIITLADSLKNNKP